MTNMQYNLVFNECITETSFSCNHEASCKVFKNYYGNHTLEKLLDSDWLTDCEFIRNMRANFVIRGKLQISRVKSICSFILKANTKKN